MQTFLNDEDFKLFSTLIYENSGIHFSETNRCILASRLKERLKNTGLKNIKEYYQMIIINQEELKVLLDTVTTNLTRFFRNTAHFNTFTKFVIPEIVKQKQKQNDYSFRIWSAGCSTGEEPYSIAIILKELLPPFFKPEIIASDLSLKSLMKANEGYYPENRIGGVKEEYLNKYFLKKTNGYKICDEIKSIIKFDYHNLKYASGSKDLDIIFCRNVLIYFDSEAQKAVINRFWNSMNKYSYLFIGHSESLFGMQTKFQFVKTQWSTLYRKNTDSIE